MSPTKRLPALDAGSTQPTGVDVDAPAGDPVGGDVEERAALHQDLATVGEHVGDGDFGTGAAAVGVEGDGLDGVGDGPEVGLPGADESGDLLDALDGIDVVEGEHGVGREAAVERLRVVRVELGVERPDGGLDVVDGGGHADSSFGERGQVDDR